MNKTNVQINIIKGIGIISVVLGHSCYFLIKYVYMYHLALFFFIGGYTYKQEKYGNNLPLLFGNRMYSIMPAYLLYSILHFSVRNTFLNLGLYSQKLPVMNGEMFIQSFVGATFFASAELIGAAFWFLPVLITGVVIYGWIVTFSNKMNDRFKNVVKVSSIFLFALSGVLLIQNNIVVAFHLENALLVLPIIALGQFYKNNKEKVDLKINFVIALVCLIFVLAVIYISKSYFELSIDRIINPFVFYAATLAGIVFWVYISKKIVNYNNTSKILSICGKYSFDIMALHLLVIKLIDYIYLEFINPNAGVKHGFPYSVRELWPIYLLGGIIIPILFRKLLHNFIYLIKNSMIKIQILSK